MEGFIVGIVVGWVLGLLLAAIMAGLGSRDRVLRLLSVDPNRWWFAQDMLDVLGFGGGVLYPALWHLEEARLVETRWIDQPSGRARRAYRCSHLTHD